MRTTCSVLIAILLMAATSFAQDRPITFGEGSLGKLPPHWTAAQTGKGEGSVWKVVEDKTTFSKSGYALAQTAKGPSAMFNLCVLDKSDFKDLVINVEFKPNAGKLDQGGGVVWRYQDATNYYVARFNPLEDNLRVYKVVNGKRTQLDNKEGLKAPLNNWHTIGIRMVGNHIECFLHGRKELDAKDDTFPKSGKVGLWTKADAQTSFDRFDVKAVK